MMFTKKEIFSIPNILCYFRILLVPVFLWAYFDLQSDEGHFVGVGGRERRAHEPRADRRHHDARLAEALKYLRRHARLVGQLA